MAHVFDEEDAGITTITEAVIRTVAYADVFDFPLRAGEIHRYLVGPKVAASTINNLLSNGHLVPAHLAHQDEYFTLPGRENIVQTRRQRAAAAAALWPLTIRYGQLIARLPFVRMVAVTGSLAVFGLALALVAAGLTLQTWIGHRAAAPVTAVPVTASSAATPTRPTRTRRPNRGRTPSRHR